MVGLGTAFLTPSVYVAVLRGAGVAGACGIALVLSTVDQVRRGEGADTTAWMIVALALQERRELFASVAVATTLWAPSASGVVGVTR